MNWCCHAGCWIRGSTFLCHNVSPKGHKSEEKIDRKRGLRAVAERLLRTLYPIPATQLQIHLPTVTLTGPGANGTESLRKLQAPDLRLLPLWQVNQ